MKHHVYFANNSDEILSELESKGFDICACCKFKNSKWLSYFYRESTKKREMHGLGYSCEHDCEDACPEKCIKCALVDGFNKSNIHIFNDIDDMIDFLNKYKL